jgi:hypothetical protein
VKVALVFKRLADSGGSERQVSMLARQLAARGDDVHVFCASVRGAVPAGVQLHVMPRLPLGRTLGLLAFSAWARRAIAAHEAARGAFDVRHAFGRTAPPALPAGQGAHRGARPARRPAPARDRQQRHGAR